MPAAVVTPLWALPREHADCAIGALALFLGVPYEEVLERAAARYGHGKSKIGLTVREIRWLSAQLGTVLRLKRRIEWSEDYGIVLWSDHACLLRSGLIVEPFGVGPLAVMGGLWDAEDYQARERRGEDPEGILVEREGLWRK